MTREHSRAIRLAAGAAGRGESDLENAMNAARVVVSADASLPGVELTTKTLLTTLRRLPGELVLEPASLSRRTLDGLAEAVAAIDPERPLTIGRSSDASARLHVGTARGDEAIRIVPEAHGAHVAGQRTARIRPTIAPSGLGCIYAAALGAAEAFKFTARVRPDRRVVHRHLRFCPVTLTSDLRAATLLTDVPDELDFTLVGVGAIGTGVSLIVSELDIAGRAIPVDVQAFALENRGTYSLGGMDDVEAHTAKVELARRALTRFDVLPFPQRVEELPDAIDRGDVPWTPLVVCGLDSPEARRAAQLLWPNQLVDAATGDTTLGLHEHVHSEGPCMICFFPEDRNAPAAVERLSEITGLPVELLVRGDEILRDEHLTNLTDDQRARLSKLVGKPVCGLARAVGLTDLDAGDYQPSIPFVSLQAAALAVGRVIAADLDSRANLVQYDGLIGPSSATLERMRPVAGCYCQTRATTIELVRARRRATQSA
jgi:hypothetical protein